MGEVETKVGEYVSLGSYERCIIATVLFFA